MDYEHPEKFRWDIVRMDRELKVPFSETLNEIYLEMPKFKLQLSDCDTLYKQWLYVLNNIEIMERLPDKLNNQIFQKLKSIVEVERMKKGLVLWLLLLAATCAEAQSDLIMVMNKEGKLIAIPKQMNYELNIPKFAYKSHTPSSTMELDRKLREFMPDLPPSIDERPMDMQVLSAAYQPFFNVFTPMIRRVSPMALDFNETSITPISDNVSFLANGRQYTWPGAGGITRVTTALVWQKDNWTVSGGAFAGRFYTPFNSSPGFTGGVNAEVGYQATDWLKLRTWGQYAEYGKEKANPHMLMNPYHNHTNVGSALELKLNDNLGVGMGVNFEYNPIRRKMEPQYMVYPIFY